MTIKTDFQVVDSKMITNIVLKKHGHKAELDLDAIFDPGSTMTTMSETLFNRIGYPLQESGNVKIIGVNSESKGFSTLIDFMKIGGVNLGRIRIVVGQLHPKFANNIIIGMNILLWYDIAISHYNKTITLVERKFKGFDMSSRFIMHNIMNLNLASYEIGGTLNKGLG